MAGYPGGNPYKGVAPALNTLLDQLNRKAPNRSKASDGALGNAAHAASISFHNPNPAGIVQARDYTHDPANGLDTHNWLAPMLVKSRDPRILEIISNYQYWTPAGGWVPYTGSNPHDHHLHLSVRSEPSLYNSTAPWNLGDDSTGGFLMALSDAQQNTLAQDAANARYGTVSLVKPSTDLIPGLVSAVGQLTQLVGELTQKVDKALAPDAS